MTDTEVAGDTGRVFTAEHLALPGLYNEVMDDGDGDGDGDGDVDGDGDDAGCCPCASCSPPSPDQEQELSFLYHKFISSLRIVPVFRNFQVDIYRYKTSTFSK